MIRLEMIREAQEDEGKIRFFLETGQVNFNST